MTNLLKTKAVKIELGEETHSQFKAATALNGQSIKDALIELIHYYIDNPKIELKK